MTEEKLSLAEGVESDLDGLLAHLQAFYLKYHCYVTCFGMENEGSDMFLAEASVGDITYSRFVTIDKGVERQTNGMYSKTDKRSD